MLWAQSRGDLATYKERLVASLRSAESLQTAVLSGAVKPGTASERLELARDGAVKGGMDRLWGMVYKEADGTVHAEEYIAWVRRLVCVTLGRMVTGQMLHTLAEEQFEVDSAGAKGVDYRMFQLSLFEYVDMRTPEKTRAAFLETLTDLYTRVTRRAPRHGWVPEAELVAIGDEARALAVAIKVPGVEAEMPSEHAVTDGVDNALRLFDTLKRMKHVTEGGAARGGGAEDDLLPVDVPVAVDVASSVMGGKVTDCSSVFSAHFQGRNVINGSTEDGPGGAWAATEGVGASITIEFIAEYTIDAMIFQQRIARMTHVAEARLSFSDGSQQYVQFKSGAGGQAEQYALHPVRTSWVRFEVTRMYADSPNANAGAISIQYLSMMLPKMAQITRDRVAAMPPRTAALAPARPVVPRLQIPDRPRTAPVAGKATPRALSARETKWARGGQPHDLNVLERVILQRMRVAEEWDDEDTRPTSCLVDLVESGMIPDTVVTTILEQGGREEDSRNFRALSARGRRASARSGSLHQRPATTSGATTPRPQSTTGFRINYRPVSGSARARGEGPPGSARRAATRVTSAGSCHAAMLSDRPKFQDLFRRRPYSAASLYGDPEPEAGSEDEGDGGGAADEGGHLGDPRHRGHHPHHQHVHPDDDLSYHTAGPGRSSSRVTFYDRSALMTPSDRGFGSPRPGSSRAQSRMSVTVRAGGEDELFEFDPAEPVSDRPGTAGSAFVASRPAARYDAQRDRDELHEPEEMRAASRLDARKKKEESKTAITTFLEEYEKKDGGKSLNHVPVAGGAGVAGAREAVARGGRLPSARRSALRAPADAAAAEKEEAELAAALAKQNNDKPPALPPNLFTMGDTAVREVTQILKEEGVRDKTITVDLFCQERPRALSPRAFWRPDTPGGPFFNGSAHRLGDDPQDDWKRYRYARPAIEDLRPQTSRDNAESQKEAAEKAARHARLQRQRERAALQQGPAAKVPRPQWAPAPPTKEKTQRQIKIARVETVSRKATSWGTHAAREADRKFAELTAKA